jgi:hypothetical protein
MLRYFEAVASATSAVPRDEATPRSEPAGEPILKQDETREPSG